MVSIEIDEKIKLKNEFLSNKNISHMLLKHIYGFKYVIQKSNKYSKRTERILLNNIELFGKYLYLYHPTIMVKDINEDVIKQYRDFCKDILNNSPKTVNKKLSSLSTFWDYLINNDNEKYFKYNIVKNISFLALDKEKSPTIIKTSELLKLFDSMRTSLYGCRDICICKIILETGLPLNTVLNLKLDNLSISKHSLSICSEDKITTNYDLGSNLISELMSYLNIRNELDLNGSDDLFLSKRGTKYSIRSFELFFKENTTRINATYAPRNLRSTFLYNISTIVNPTKLQEISNQQKVNHYYELAANPLRNLI